MWLKRASVKSLLKLSSRTYVGKPGVVAHAGRPSTRRQRKAEPRFCRAVNIAYLVRSKSCERLCLKENKVDDF